MSRRFIYYLSTLVTAAAVPVVCYSISRMIPPGMAGDFSEVKRWFIVLTAMTVLGSISFFIMLYNRSMLDGANNLSTETDILAAAAREMAERQRANAVHASQPSQPTTPKRPLAK